MAALHWSIVAKSHIGVPRLSDVIAHHGYSTSARAGEFANEPAATAMKAAAESESGDMRIAKAFPERVRLKVSTCTRRECLRSGGYKPENGT